MGTLERTPFAFFHDFGSWTLQITRTAAASPCGLALCLCRSSSVLMSLHSFILWNRKLRLTDTGQLPAQGQWLGSFFFFFFLIPTSSTSALGGPAPLPAVLWCSLASHIYICPVTAVPSSVCRGPIARPALQRALGSTGAGNREGQRPVAVNTLVCGASH